MQDKGDETREQKLIRDQVRKAQADAVKEPVEGGGGVGFDACACARKEGRLGGGAGVGWGDK